MPMTNGQYVAPTWQNNGQPPLNSTELQAMSDTLEIVPTLVRPNLLDNWYFVGGGSQQGGGQFPINQRGNTYTSGYTIDRWANPPAISIALDSDGIIVTPTATNNGRVVVQGLQGMPLLGKTVTLSLLCTSSEINNVYISIYGNNTYGSAYDTYIASNKDSRIAGGDGVYLISVTATMPNEFINASRDKLLFGFGFVNTGSIVPSFTAIAAKLEYGNTQTLAHQDENGNWVLNEIPNYQQELAKCQRYQIELVTHGDTAIGCVGTGQPTSSTLAYIFVPTPSTMRAVPTVTFSGSWKLARVGTTPTSGSTVSAMSVVSKSANGVTLQVTSSGLSTSYEYALWHTGSDGNDSLLLDANL